MKVVKVHTAHMIAISQTKTEGLDSKGLLYEKSGGNQGNAWSRGNSGWDDDE